MPELEGTRGNVKLEGEIFRGGGFDLGAIGAVEVLFVVVE